MAINVAEITSVLKREIAGFEQQLQTSEVGTVIEVGDGIARIYGLRNAMAGELLDFNGVMGQVFNLEQDSIGAVIFGDYLKIKEGDTVKSTGRLLEVPVGEAVIGRVVNPLGQPLDGGPARSHTTETRKLDIVAPGIAERQPVTEPMLTGIKAIDSMIPIGRGQRELIIGDRKTGKTAIAVDTIIEPEGQGREVLLRRRRPEGSRRSPPASWRPCEATARWSTRRSSSPAPPTPPRCSTSPPTPARPWPSTSCGRARPR